ncbi:MAG: cob(I)yrinic acid a,c-diamide adenosyltransferase [Bacteroidota bacterium]
MTKLYTKTGDKGETSLFGGKRVSKDDQRICACGDVDELNASLGIVRSLTDEVRVEEMIGQIQRQLFVLGADLAAPKGIAADVPRVTEEDISQLERFIDSLEGELPPLRNFLLPGGHPVAAHLHLARTICRRAERSTVALFRTEGNGELAIKYLNRLSDLLFVLSRWVNLKKGVDEEKWRAR